MRVLEVNGFFRLPDGWSGTFSDALRVLAEYHEGDDRKDTELTGNGDTERDRTSKWDSFLESIAEGFRVDMAVGLCEVSLSAGTTTELRFPDMPKKPGTP